MPISNDYTTGKVLEYSCHQNYHKLIGTSLSKQKITTIPLQFILNVSIDSLIVKEQYKQ